MSLIYMVMKLYPVFGISLTFLFFDLFRNLRRKGNRAYIGMFCFALIFLASTIVWFVLAGYKNADVWFNQLNHWFEHG